MKKSTKLYTQVTRNLLPGDSISRNLTGIEISASTLRRWCYLGLIDNRGHYVLTAAGYKLR